MNKKSSENATACPICKTRLDVGKEIKHTIIVCKECDNSLFMYRSKTITKIIPFALNAGIEGNKLVPEYDSNEFEEYEEFNSDDEEDYD